MPTTNPAGCSATNRLLKREAVLAIAFIVRLILIAWGDFQDRHCESWSSALKHHLVVWLTLSGSEWTQIESDTPMLITPYTQMLQTSWHLGNLPICVTLSAIHLFLERSWSLTFGSPSLVGHFPLSNGDPGRVCKWLHDILGCPWLRVGKIVFCVADLCVAWLIIRHLERSGVAPNTASAWYD